jgi:hypothetical protein
MASLRVILVAIAAVGEPEVVKDVLTMIGDWRWRLDMATNFCGGCRELWSRVEGYKLADKEEKV